MDLVLDMDHQRMMVEADKRRKHEDWCRHHTQAQRFEKDDSMARALILVEEAHRLERQHLHHQLAHCKKMLRRQQILDAAGGNGGNGNGGGAESDTISHSALSPARRTTNGANAAAALGLSSPSRGTPARHSPSRSTPAASPSRLRCESNCAFDCPCVRAPIFRQLLPKYRAMNLLQRHFADCDLEPTIEALRQTYSSDHEMVEDLLQRYGPEDPTVDPQIWLRSIRERQKQLGAKWRSIASAVRFEFRVRDNFPTVIRNLSIMRIFLEGSQASSYSCDVTERARRDAVHNQVLDELARRGSLFLDTDAIAELGHH